MALEHRLAEQAEALVALLGSGLAGRPDDDLRAVLATVGSLRRLVDSLGSLVAGEVERRCAESALAARCGERSAAAAVVAEAGIDEREAAAWCVVGKVSTPRRSLLGEDLVPERPEIADAVMEAEHGAAALARIVTTLDEVERRAPAAAVGLGAVLLTSAASLGSRDLARLCRSAIEAGDPDGAEPREDELRRRAGLRVIRLPDGLLRWEVTMDPEAAGFLQTALDARTAPRREVTFGDGLHDPAQDDTRTLAHRRLDALVGIARTALRADDGEVAGADVTMLVTVPFEVLECGLGAAWIDGVDAPVCARTARRLAADARLIPVVLGGESEPLDLGRAARLFSPAQRRALSIRDGGCVWPGCGAPPGWCEVAHVEPWARGGPTDLGNAMLLCPFHHRRFDLDGWGLEQREGERWLIPPGWLDASRTPRRVRSGARGVRVAA